MTERVNRRSSLWVMAIVVALASQGRADIEVHVSPAGDDVNPGTRARPLRTLEAARDAIRKQRKAGKTNEPATVWLAEGVYVRTKGFALSGQDSGTAEARVSYRAAPGGRPRLVGGVEIKPEWFEPVRDDAIRKRLRSAVRDKIRQVDLRAHGLTDYGELGGLPGGMRFFIGERRLPLARWPNEGWALGRRGRVTGKDEHGVPEVEDTGRTCKWMAYRFEGEPPARWHDLERTWLCGFFWEEYCFHSWHAKAVDHAKQQVTFGHGLVDHLKEWRRFVVVDALEEIDAPGEWAIDRQRGVLFMLPPEELGREAPVVSRVEPLLASTLSQTMISLDRVSHVTLRGLTLEVMRESAVHIGGGAANRIEGCTIRHAKYGATISGGEDHAIVGCDIYDLGAAGVQVSGGDRATLTPGRHAVVNNHIYHYAKLYKTWQPGVRVKGVGHRIAHNAIHHAPQYAISYEGNDHVFELNHMHHLCLEMSDVGVIGCGTNWTYRGNVIRHNFIHHIPKRPYPGVCGVYLDNCACSADIVGNVFYKMTKPVMIGGGRDNLVENNVFVECEVPVFMDNRGLRWRTRWGHFRPGGPMYKPLRELKHDRPPWSERYPKLAGILDDCPQAPLGNVLRRNVSVRSGWRDPEAFCRKLFSTHIDRPYMTIADNVVTDDDPGFVDAAAMDFRLRGDSIVFKNVPGFRPIPFERIGPYQDELRASWPIEPD